MRTCSHHHHKITLALFLLLALSLLSCGVGADQPTDAPTDTPGAGIPEGDLGLTVRNISTGETVVAQDIGQFQDHIPFAIVVPQYLPADVRLASMSGSIGGPGRIRAESVSLSFHSTKPGEALNMIQAPLPEGMEGQGISGDNVEDVAIGDVMGRLQETEEPDRHFITMVWAGCGLDFTLIGSGQRGREELVQVAESTLSCRGLR
jgi:hypothetical protein